MAHDLSCIPEIYFPGCVSNAMEDLLRGDWRSRPEVGMWCRQPRSGNTAPFPLALALTVDDDEEFQGGKRVNHPGTTLCIAIGVPTIVVGLISLFAELRD